MPSSTTEVTNIANALIARQEPKAAAEFLGMSTRQLVSRCNNLGIELNIGQVYKSEKEAVVAAVQQTLQSFDAINNLIKSAVPSSMRAKFKDARIYADTDDLVQTITRTKADFIQSGFRVESKDKSVQDYCNEINRSFNMDAIVQQMGDSASVENNIIFYSKIEKGDPQEVNILDPYWTEVVPLYVTKKRVPQKAVVYHLNDDFKALYGEGLTGAGNQNKTTVKDAKSLLDPRYLQAVRNKGAGGIGKNTEGWGRDGVELSAETGEFVEIINHKGLRDQLVAPGMTAIFKDIRLRQMIVDGDYSIFYHVKHLIHQIQAGSSSPKTLSGNPLVNQLMNQKLTSVQALELKAIYTDIEKVHTEVTDDTVKHIYNFPDPKIFDLNKYIPVEQRILRWGGISLVLIEGSGANYSGGYIYMKSLYNEVMKWRKLIQRTLENFYVTIAPKSGPGALYKKMTAWDTRPQVLFDNNLFKEPKQLLDECRFMLENGGMSWETIHEILGVPHGIEYERRSQEWLEAQKGKFPFFPLFEAKQGLTTGHTYFPDGTDPDDVPAQPKGTDGEPGAPIKDGSQTNKNGSPRAPRPSTAKDEPQA
jgi:hypothetical protein